MPEQAEHGKVRHAARAAVGADAYHAAGTLAQVRVLNIVHLLQGLRHLGRVQQGAVALFRVGCVGGLSVEADLQTIAAPGAQADIGEGLAVKAGAGLGDDREVHVREIAVLNEGIGAQAVGALLVRDQRQLDLPGEGLVGGGEAGSRDHQRGAAGFHVQLAVGIAGPTAAQLHGVQMAVQADDRSGSAAVDNGDDIFSMEICDLGIVVFVQLCGQSLPAQPVSGKGHDLVLVEIRTLNGGELLQKCCDLSFFYH